MASVQVARTWVVILCLAMSYGLESTSAVSPAESHTVSGVDDSKAEETRPDVEKARADVEARIDVEESPEKNTKNSHEDIREMHTSTPEGEKEQSSDFLDVEDKQIHDDNRRKIGRNGFGGESRGGQVDKLKKSSRVDKRNSKSGERESYAKYGIGSKVEAAQQSLDDVRQQKKQTSERLFEEDVIDFTAVPIVTRQSDRQVKIPVHQPHVDPDHRHHHRVANNINLTVTFENSEYLLVLDLHPTRDLLAATFQDPDVLTMRNGDGDGSILVACEFQGEVRGVKESWVALSLCGHVRGVVVGLGKELMVEPTVGASAVEDLHRVFSTSLLQQPSRVCGVESSNKNHSSSSNNNSVPLLHRTRRSTLHGGPLWTNLTTRFVELVLVADHSFYTHFGEKTSSHCKEVVNIANALYRGLGVVVVLTHLEIWDSKDKIEVSVDSGKTLDNLSKYRQKFLKEHPELPNDNMQLLTMTDFDGPVIGKALIFGMCSRKNSVGVTQVMPESGSALYAAQTLAHEMGHNLGLHHDEEDKDCECEEDECIMNAHLSSVRQVTWSTCSKRNLTHLSEKAFSLDCMKNTPTQLFAGGGCGDGVVDWGEECDCGPKKFCTNPCCVAETCKLAPNASCASGTCCNTETCQFLLYQALCRAARDDCDFPEYCTGHSEFCPYDSIQADGTYCNDYKGHCYKGECGSHEGRCQQVWGPSGTQSLPLCYSKHNQAGDDRGNCGLDYYGTETQPCAKEDVLCGTLHCEADKDAKPMYGYVKYSLWSGFGLQCRTVFATDSVPPPFWLTPNGASCGDGKMCIDQRCVAVPVSLLTILFWTFVVLVLLVICCMWDHVWYWWRDWGHERCSIHLPYCASCLNSCCCPCMNKITWMITIPLMSRATGKCKSVCCPCCAQQKSSRSAANTEIQNTNIMAVTHVTQNSSNSTQRNSWGDEDQRLMVETRPPANSQPSSGTSAKYHPSVDQYSADWPIASPSDIIDVPIKDNSVKTYEAPYKMDGQDKFLQQDTVDSQKRIIPVRTAPPPPVQKPVQRGTEILSPADLITSEIGSLIAQTPETVLPPISEPVISARPEPVVPQRPDFTMTPRPEPIVPARPETIIPQRTEPVIPHRPQPAVPLRPEIPLSSREKPIVPPKPGITK